MTDTNLDMRLLRFRTRPGSEPAERLATDLLSVRRAVEALEVIGAAREANPTDVNLRLLEGRAHFAAKDLLKAQALLLEVVRDAPSAAAFVWLGEVLAARGDTARARKVAERAIALAPQDPHVVDLASRVMGSSAGAVRTPSVAGIPAPTREAAQREAAQREATQREAAQREAAQREAAQREAAQREAAQREAAQREAAQREAAQREAAQREAAQREAAQREAAQREAAQREAAQREAAQREAAQREAAQREAAQREAAQREAAKRDALRRPMPKPTSSPGAVAAPLPPGQRAPTGAFSAAPAPLTDDSAVTLVRDAEVMPRAVPSRESLSRETAAPADETPRVSSVPPPLPSQRKSPSGDRWEATGGRAARAIDSSPSFPKVTAPPAAEVPADALSTSPGGFAAPARGGSPRQANRANADEATTTSPGDRPSEAPAELRVVGTAAASEHDGYDEGAPADDDLIAGDAAPEEVPDLVVGDRYGTTDRPESILAMLEQKGLFEAPKGAPQTWATKAESRPERTRVGGMLGGTWALVIAVGASGLFGVKYYIDQRHAQADALIIEATDEANLGDAAALASAETHLRDARRLDPNDNSQIALVLFVQMERALEDGTFEVAPLRPTMDRANSLALAAPYAALADAILATEARRHDDARAAIARALEAAPEDARVLYVAGRLEQRLGTPSAVAHIERAVERDPALTAATLALAEARHDLGRDEDARTLVDGVLTRAPEHLRAKLFHSYLTSNDVEVEPGLATLEALRTRIDESVPTDRVLAALVRARLERRAGRHEQAETAIESALAAGTVEPRLLARIASAALAEHRLELAERAATDALRAAPDSLEIRRLLARIELDRRSANRALQTLATLPPTDPDVIRMQARAALILGSPEVIQHAKESIQALLEAGENDTPETRALDLRLAFAQTRDARRSLATARALSRANPGNTDTAYALGEIALAAGETELAATTLTTVVQASPDDADAHFLLGRAERARGRVDEARSHLERSVELVPEHAAARARLGDLLLENGQYDAALETFGELARRDATVDGLPTALVAKVGRIDALVGLGRTADARVQLESIREADRNGAEVRWTAARLAMAERHFGDAVTLLRPFTEGESPTADALALYADALVGAGEVDASIASYERALELDEHHPEALLGRAELFVRAERYRDATRALEDAAEAIESRHGASTLVARLHFIRGRAALAQREISTARNELRQATALAGAPSAAFFYLGEALSGGNWSEAAEAYRRYISLPNPDRDLVARAEHAMAVR